MPAYVLAIIGVTIFAVIFRSVAELLAVFKTIMRNSGRVCIMPVKVQIFFFVIVQINRRKIEREHDEDAQQYPPQEVPIETIQLAFNSN